MFRVGWGWKVERSSGSAQAYVLPWSCSPGRLNGDGLECGLASCMQSRHERNDASERLAYEHDLADRRGTILLRPRLVLLACLQLKVRVIWWSPATSMCHLRDSDGDALNVGLRSPDAMTLCSSHLVFAFKVCTAMVLVQVDCSKNSIQGRVL